MLFVGILTVLFVLGAVVVDVALWVSERRMAQRVADLSALAGAADLLLDDDAAVDSALEWAAKNGYQEGVDGVDVSVELLCDNPLTNPPAGICSNGNPPGAGPSACDAGDGCDSLRVEVRKPAAGLFTSIFGIGDIEVSAAAAAGLELDAVVADTVLLLDATGSMSEPPCEPRTTPAGCPLMSEARVATNGFVDLLVGGDGGLSQLAYAPYNHCYNPPQTASTAKCVSLTNVAGLTTDAAGLHTAVDNTVARGATNVCLPLLKAWELFNGPNGRGDVGVRRSVVMLADGDNNYTHVAYSAALDYPPPACRPSNPTVTENTLQGCRPPSNQDREMDVKTWQAASWLKGQGIEVFVVGFDVCGIEDGRTALSLGYCDGIGDGAHDNFADQRLLKCMASSPDHYLRVSSPDDLPKVFRLVAGKIIGRRLLQ